MTPCKNILTFAANFSYPLLSNEFLSFSENSTFDFMIRFLLLLAFGVPLVSNPSLRSFLHTAMPRLCQSSEPCSNSLIYLLLFKRWCERSRGGWGGGGGGSKFNRVLLHRWTHPNLYISTLFITLQPKVHSRRWRSPRVKTKYTASPHIEKL